MLNEVTKMQLEQEIRYLEKLVEKCEKERLTDEQWFIEAEDRLNKLSTKDHNRY